MLDNVSAGTTTASLTYADVGRLSRRAPLDRVAHLPDFRYMGSKRRLLPWIFGVLERIDFESALDPFAGSSAVAYLIKAMGRRVTATDFLNFSATIARALVENNNVMIGKQTVDRLLTASSRSSGFIENTFQDIFYTRQDLSFLDRVSRNLEQISSATEKAMVLAALMRSCVKRQPRGVFTVSGNLDKYDDGRRDLRLSIEEHFLEQIGAFNRTVFSNGKRNKSGCCDVFDARPGNFDLVYLDPPYVPRADDNCYIKRYHFLEGLSCYWKGMSIDRSTKVRKIPKRYTPFSYRSKAISAFDHMFHKFRRQKIVLSYSSNGFPDLDALTNLLGKYKRKIQVIERPHRYHFGTHKSVRRAAVTEYLIIGC